MSSTKLVQLASDFPAVGSLLQELSRDERRFYNVLDRSLGAGYDRPGAEELRQQWAAGDLRQLPAIEVLDIGINGLGAYATSTNRIYLSRTALETGDSAVLLEEIGHFLDARLNASDTVGDEGELFSALARGETLTPEAIAAILGEDDAGVVVVDGEAIDVEMAFAPATNLPAGRRPTSVAAGDFDGDGDLDLAVTNQLDNNVSVFLGDGSGNFQPAVNFPTGSWPLSVAVGDFNGDGRPDLVTSNNNGTVSILLGNGSGGFGSPTAYTVGSNPRSVAVADFNGDGKLDLAVANYFGDNISVLLGNGNGTFAPATNRAAGGRPYPVVAADLDGDGDLDLVTANAFDPITNTIGNRVSVLTNNGSGVFAPAVNFPAGTGPITLTVADFTGDNLPDIAVSNFTEETDGFRGISILPGTGRGGFGSPIATPLTSGDTLSNRRPFLTTTDFNLDGKADLVTADINNDTVTVLLGKGDGTFSSIVQFAVGDGPVAVAVGDFNGDGKPDLAASNSFSNNLSILLNRTARITIAPGTAPVEGQTPGSFVLTLDTPAPSGGLSVSFDTLGSTATPGTDYTLTAGTNVTGLGANTFTIAAGATTATLGIVAGEDGIADNGETVRVNLIAGGDYILGNDASATVTIVEMKVFTVVEAIGNRSLVRDSDGRYYSQAAGASPVAITWNGQQVVENLYPGWQILAVENVDGENQVLWRDSSGDTLEHIGGENQPLGPDDPGSLVQIWLGDNNWNRVSADGNYGSNTSTALGWESDFGIDVNGDGVLGYLPLETGGNFQLILDRNNRYRATSTSGGASWVIGWDGQEIYPAIYPNWNPLAVENIDGENRVLWKNAVDAQVQVWYCNEGWNRVSAEGNFALNSDRSRAWESDFGVDIDGDGIIGTPAPLPSFPISSAPAIDPSGLDTGIGRDPLALFAPVFPPNPTAGGI